MRGVTEQATTLPLFPLPQHTYILRRTHGGSEERVAGGKWGRAPFTAYPLQKERKFLNIHHVFHMEASCSCLGHLVLNSCDGSSARDGTQLLCQKNVVPSLRCKFQCKYFFPALINGCWQGNLHHRF